MTKRLPAITGLGLAASVLATLVSAAPEAVTQPTALSPAEAFRGAASVAGFVYYDENGNGRRDAGEAPAPGVQVTAGCQIATTDAAGHYALMAKVPCLTVSVSFPNGTWPTTSWFRRLDHDPAEGVDFGLRREPLPSPLVFVHFTDPHNSIDKSPGLIFQECQGLPIKPKFYLLSGDLRTGDPRIDKLDDIRSQFGRMQKAVGDFPAPIFCTPGNHDTVEIGPPDRILTSGVQAHPYFGERAFEKFVNPSHWSFTCGGVHFVGWHWADYVDGKWEFSPPAMKAWLETDLQGVPKETRTVALTHAGAPFPANLTLCGHSHAEGPAFGKENHLQGGCSFVTDRAGQPNKFGADGRPVGYRIVVVEDGRMDHFFKALGVDRPIMVNTPRRNGLITKSGSFILRAQVFDPAAKVQRIKATLDGKEIVLEQTARRMWSDVAGQLDVKDWADGFYALRMTAQFPDGTYTLTEPHLILTGKARDAGQAGEATLKGQRERMTQPIKVRLNGEPLGEVKPTDKTFAFPVPASVLKRLNTVSFGDNTDAMPLKDVRLEAGGQEFRDQRMLGWWPDQRVSAKDTLYIDLKTPGPVAEWAIRKE